MAPTIVHRLLHRNEVSGLPTGFRLVFSPEKGFTRDLGTNVRYRRQREKKKRIGKAILQLAFPCIFLAWFSLPRFPSCGLAYVVYFTIVLENGALLPLLRYRTLMEIESSRDYRAGFRGRYQVTSGHWSLVFIYGAGLGQRLLRRAVYYRCGCEIAEFFINRDPVVIESRSL